MKRVLSGSAGLITLLLWLQIAGPANPHVVELSLGLILGIGVAIYFYFAGIPKLIKWWNDKVAKAKLLVKEKTTPRS